MGISPLDYRSRKCRKECHGGIQDAILYYWQRVETYIKQHADVTFTHAICPDCKDKYYSKLPMGEDGLSKQLKIEQA